MNPLVSNNGPLLYHFSANAHKVAGCSDIDSPENLVERTKKMLTSQLNEQLHFSSQLYESYEISDTDTVLAEIEQQRKEIQRQSLLEVQKMIYLLGKSFQSLTDDLAKLKTENRLLREDMVQLKIVYAAEENNFHIAAITIVNDIRQKIQSLLDPADKENLKIIEQRMIATHGTSIGTLKFEQYQGARYVRESFHKLTDKLMGMCDEPQFQQRTVSPGENVQVAVQTLSTFSPLLNVVIRTPIKPAVQRFIQERLSLCQTLETETIPVRVTNQSLLKQKESLIFEHQKHMCLLKNTFKMGHFTAIQASFRELMTLASKCLQDWESSQSKDSQFTKAKCKQAESTLKVCQSVMRHCEQFLTTLEK